MPKVVLTFYNMKYFLVFFLLIATSINAQDFSKVDHLVLKYPRFSKVEDLASKIENDFSTDTEKVRAAFFWLAKNIRYDLKMYYNPKPRTYGFSYSTEDEKTTKIQAAKDKIIDVAFNRKMGVCEEYAQSFKKICDLLNIEAAVITGYTRNSTDEIGKPSLNTDHAWNAVKLNDKWILLDATWAAGSLLNGKWIQEFNNYFYNIPKEKIFKTHFPENSVWVLRFGRITKEEFYKQPIFGYTFLASNAQLIDPKKGIIEITKANNIELKFKNLDKNTLVYYTFKGSSFAKKPVKTLENGITTISIPNAKRNSELNIFMNNSIAIQFRTF